MVEKLNCCETIAFGFCTLMAAVRLGVVWVVSACVGSAASVGAVTAWPQVVCHSEGALVTVFSSFLGIAFNEESEYTAHLDKILSERDLAQELPGILIAEGIAQREESDLCVASVRFCAARHCHSLGEALREIRDVFSFVLEATLQEAHTDELRELVADAADVAELVSEEGEKLTSNALPRLIDHLKQQGRSGARLHRPLRLLLTGRPDGARVADVVHLLELAEREGGDEIGPTLSDRLLIARQAFGTWKLEKEAFA